MDTFLCSCSAPATHRCISCSPKVSLCLKCIPTHLELFPNDSIISNRSQSRSLKDSIPCSHCQSQSSEFLQVLSDAALPTCKQCKKSLKSEDSIFISLKWREIVHCTRDLQEVNIRNNILKTAIEELESSFNSEEPLEYFNVIEHILLEMIQKWVNDQRNLAQEVITKEVENLKKTKRELENQIIKREFDLSTNAGKMLESIKTNGFSLVPKKKINFYTNDDLLERVNALLNSIKITRDCPGSYLYVFNPGKTVLTRINLEKMVRSEENFNKSWTFEPSWLGLDDKSIFFCGGNGVNNSEVLVINYQERTIVSKRAFNGRSGHSLVEKEGFVYAFGGNRGKFAERYSLDQDIWQILTDIPYKLVRTSSCLSAENIFITGNDCSLIVSYASLEDRYYDIIGSELERSKNKILFSYNDVIYCMCGDKLYYANINSMNSWQVANIIDRDWWTYCKPVFYNGCMYFIKYFVRNMWILNLTTFELREVSLSDIPVEH